MRNLAAAVIAFACFMDPMERGIWVASSEIVAVLHDVGDCASGSHTKIVTSAGKFCVRETPQEVLKIINEETHK